VHTFSTYTETAENADSKCVKIDYLWYINISRHMYQGSILRYVHRDFVKFEDMRRSVKPFRLSYNYIGHCYGSLRRTVTLFPGEQPEFATEGTTQAYEPGS